MKKLFFLLILTTTTTCFSIEGTKKMNNNNYNYGSQRYGKEILDFIQGNGSVFLEGTNVLGLVQINGSLNTVESSINSLQVNGQADLQNCVISNTTSINGSLNATNTVFQKDLIAASQKIVLTMCTVNSITIREINGYSGTQVIDLRSGTNVTGPIVVESNNGEIWISSDSKILENQVSGAKILKK